MAIRESDIRDMTKAMMSTVMKTVSAGRKTVIAPTEIRKTIKDITENAESGSIKRFEAALFKTEKILDQLNIDLKDFNTGLAKTLKDTMQQRQEKTLEVEKLRSENIVAEVKVKKQGKEFAYETKILTKKEIEQRTKLNERRKKLLEVEEQKVLKKRENLLDRDRPLTQKQQETLVKEQEQLNRKRELIEKEDATLNPLKEQEDGTSGPPSSFYEELKAPFIAVGDAFMSLRDIGKDVVRVFKFFSEGGLTKSLKKFASGIKTLARFFMSTKVLIGLAIVGVIAAIVFFKDKIKAAADFIMGIPDMIGNFIKNAFIRISDFFKDMINTVIKLINKYIPFANVPLLETSAMKEEKEKKEKNKKIESTTEGRKMTVDEIAKSSITSTNPEAIKRQEKLKKFDEEAFIKTSQEQYGSHIAPFELSDREKFKFMRTGKAPDPNELTSLSKENMEMKSQAPVIVNNLANQSNVSSNGAVVSGFVNNKNVDDTFLNLNSATA